MTPLPDPSDEIAVALAHAPSGARPALAALFALDARLGQVARTTSEPIIGQMRLAWWRDALARLDTAPPPAEPLLAALADAIGVVRGAELSALTDAWEAALLASPSEEAQGRRGETLFSLAGRILGGPVPGGAGAGWALADAARQAVSAADREAMIRIARDRIASAFAERWPASTRALGLLALFARFEIDAVPSVNRAMRSIRFRFFGR